MPQRTITSTVNFVLTNYAQGFSNELLRMSQLADALMPTVQVAGASGGYKIFDDRNSFSVYNTQRGLGGQARRILFDATDGTFSAEPQALEVTVDDHERNLAGMAGGLGDELLDQGKIRALLNGTGLSHIDKVVQFVIANTAPVGGVGVWSNAANDPIAELDAQLDALSNDVGSTNFITVVLSTTAWRTLRNHAKVTARTTGVQVSGISVTQLEAMLIFPVRVVVGAVSKVTSKPGQAVAKGNVVGSNVIITYSVPNPTPYDPSAFKCFTTGQGNVQSVRTYRDEGARSDVHAVDWSEDMRKTSALAVKRLAIT